jgi:hypothetical protein
VQTFSNSYSLEPASTKSRKDLLAISSPPFSPVLSFATHTGMGWAVREISHYPILLLIPNAIFVKLNLPHRSIIRFLREKRGLMIFAEPDWREYGLINLRNNIQD